MSDDVCGCGHTHAWHMADSRFTKKRYCVVAGCTCQDFESRGKAA